MIKDFNFNNKKYNLGKITLIYYSDKKSRETVLNENKDVFIELSKKGILCSDINSFMFSEKEISEMIRKYVKEINEKQKIIECKSEITFDALRVEIKEKNIDIEDVKIYFINEKQKNCEIHLFKNNGRIIYEPAPIGFLDTRDNLLEKLLW